MSDDKARGITMQDLDRIHRYHDQQNAIWAGLVVEVLGSFTQVQFAVDTLATSFFKKEMSELSTFLNKRLLDRVKDEERVELLLGIARHLGSDAPVAVYKEVFLRVKHGRDLIAHSPGVRPCILEGRMGVNFKSHRGYQSAKKAERPPSGVPEIIREEHLRQWIREARWLSDVAMYVVSEFELRPLIDIAGEPCPSPRPPDLPYASDGESVWDYPTPPQ
ncbi:hypothetical protein [Nocardia jiangsuensis]|uniref:Uncharacterized protein n=1 Tax=Nocardia jiangsuensis TaxID=1691563 RepID=A0ABV8DWE8_9NOCA